MIDLVFLDLGIIIIAAAVVTYLARAFKQPLIPAYILTGLILGPGIYYLSNIPEVQKLFGIPAATYLITNSEIIRTFSEIGIAFLLFIVGLEIDLKRLKDVEYVAIGGGIIQMLLLFIGGFFLAQLLGFVQMDAVYIGLLLIFSSTMVVIKILSDKKELDTLHGRIIVGTLLTQDIVAILVLLMLTSSSFTFGSLFWLFVLGIICLFGALLIGYTLLPHFFKKAAKSPELLVLLSLAVCFLFSLLFASIGFSIAIGAFVAGVVLGNLPYNIEIIGRIRSLRDFFATLFFVSLGMQLVVGELSGMLLPLLLIVLFVILCKPLIILLTTTYFGYKKRTTFMTSISLAQVSEFSLIIVAQGLVLGHISHNIFTLTVLAAIITIIISTYLIKYDYQLYSKFSKDLGIFDKLQPNKKHLEYLPKKAKYEALLCGYDRTGFSIFQKLLKLKKSFLVIDFNPLIIKELMKDKIPCMYGDVGNPEILERINLKHFRYVVSTVPDEQTNLFLIETIKKHNKKAAIFVTAHHVDDALMLYDAGADYVILPHFLSGDHVSLLLEDATKDLKKLMKKKLMHINHLHTTKKLGHHHRHYHH